MKAQTGSRRPVILLIQTGVAVVVAAIATFGQPAARPTFEIASIKPAANVPMGMRRLPDGLRATAPLKLLMQSAYRVQSFQIAGGADWMDSERYSIDAKSVGNPGRDQVSAMLQSLLEERFQLKTHRETRQLPVFHLVVARGGAKLPVPKEDGCVETDDVLPWPNGSWMAPPGSGSRPLTRCGSLNVTLEMGGARISGGKVGMPELAQSLSALLGRTVIDQTGMTGLFDVRLDFQADDSTPSLPPPPPGAVSETATPSIFAALPEQLGLRLEAARGPVDVIVIDHAERPSAN